MSTEIPVHRRNRFVVELTGDRRLSATELKGLVWMATRGDFRVRIMRETTAAPPPDPVRLEVS